MEENKENQKRLKETFAYIGKLFFSALIVILLSLGAVLLFITVEGRISISKGKTPLISIFTIVSGSMEPAIGVFDIIVDTRVEDFSKVKVGDVITFNRLMTGDTSEKKITHRVIDVRIIDEKYEYITKGDANSTADTKPVQERDLIGKTLVRIPKLGIITYALLSKMGWVIIVLLPALGVVIYDVIKLFKVAGLNISANKVEKQTQYDPKINEENKQIEATIEKIKKKYGE